MSQPVVLVVDDEEEHRQLTTYLLRADYELRSAASGDEALAIADTDRVDIALVDQRMPGMSGVELLAELKVRQPSCVRFLVTAYSDPSTLADAINVAAVYRFLAKPIDPEMLRVDLRRALEHRDSDAALARAEKLALLGTLASTVAHDLNNYTQVLHILPDLLAKTADFAVVRQAAAELRHVDQSIGHLAAELLAFLRGEAPKYDLQRGALGDLVRDVVKLETRTEEFASRTVTVSVAQHLPDVRLSKPRCSRLVSNLLRNAAQATGTGGRVEVIVQPSGSDGIELIVQDNGPGVPAELRDRIFDPLFTTKAERGTGLGLSICKTIVEGHGGTLELAPRAGYGARFVARFPV